MRELKSSGTALKHAFNSLEAQGNACARTQRHQAGPCSPTRCEDNGVSGGSLQRHTLQAPLDHIAAGEVDLALI